MTSLQSIRVAFFWCGAALALSAGCASAPSGQAQAPKPDSIMTGYGAESTSASSGSVTSLATDKLAAQSPTSIEQWLATRVPGLEVIHLANGDFTLKIHGASSFMMNTEPLVVIDGSALPPGGLRSVLGSINPRDVAHIDVLKEAGSTAIYGARGANGVVVITTRRGN